VSAKRVSSLTGAASKAAILYWIQQGRIECDRAAGTLDSSQEITKAQAEENA